MRTCLFCGLLALLLTPAVQAQTKPAAPDKGKNDVLKILGEKGTDTPKEEGDKPGPLKPEILKAETPKVDMTGSMMQKVGGRTIDQWIAEIPSKDRSRGELAIRAIQMFDPQSAQRAVPAIIKELRKHTGNNILDTSIRVNGVIALGEILGAVENPNPAQTAEAVEVLTRMLRDSQTIVKYRTCLALAKLGPAAMPAANELMGMLNDRSTWETRQAAATALGTIGYNKTLGPNPAILKALYGTLTTDSASRVRLAAIQAFTFLGPPRQLDQRQNVEKALAWVALHDPDLTVRLWCHMAIMGLDGKVDPQRVAQIGKLLETEDSQVRLQTIQALNALGTEARSEIPRLITALDDDDKMVSGAAIMALANMKRWSEPAVPKLQVMANNKDIPDYIRHLAEQAIDIIQERSDAKELKVKDKK
jgi:HEAT repeat protein